MTIDRDTAKDFLDRRRAAESRAALAKHLHAKVLAKAFAFLADPHQDGVFFYPRCGRDYLHPLKEFAHTCDTFIFCDWGFAEGGNRTEDTFRAWYQRLKNLAAIDQDAAVIAHWIADVRLDDGMVQKLTNMDELVARLFPQGFDGMPQQVQTLREYLATPNPARAMCAELRVHGQDGKTHVVQVFFFAAEAVNLYLKLFAGRNKAPEYLCVKRRWNIHEWTQLNDWDAHLGQLLSASKVLPKYLIDYSLQPGWPYLDIPVDEFPGWHEHGQAELVPKVWARTQAEADVWRGYKWDPRWLMGQ